MGCSSNNRYHGWKIQNWFRRSRLRTSCERKPVAKVSRRDLAEVFAKGVLGATTVATTMIGAHLAGIKVFVTGGIGGGSPWR